MSSNKLAISFLAIFAACIFSACGGHGPKEIQYGIDQCEYCKMTIADQSFGCELVTPKGRVLKFDSIECLAAADIRFAGQSQDVESRWVTDFKQPGQFLDANNAWLIASDRQKSPMGVGLLAASSEPAARQLIDELGGRIVTLSEIREIVKTAWKLE